MKRQKILSLRFKNFSVKTLLFFLFISLVFSQTAFGQNPQEAAVLELNNTLTREISGEEKHVYHLSLSANQYAGIIVKQQGVDVSVRVFGADDKLISVFDSEIRDRGTETIELLAVTPEKFKLQIETKFKNAPGGHYEIRLTELRDAAERDVSLQKARTALSQSVKLYQDGNYKEALDFAEQALKIREQILGSESAAAADVLNRIAMIYYALGDNIKSEDFLNRTLEIYRKVFKGDDLVIANPLNNLAVIYKGKGEYMEAEKFYLQALDIREKALGADHNLIASTLNNLGILYRSRGDYEKSQKMYERSLEIRERLFGKDHPDLTSALLNLATLSYYRGDYESALALDRRVLEIREKSFGAEHPSVVNILVNLGLTYTKTGDFEQAESLFLRALEITEKKFGKNHVNSADIKNNLAQLYFEKGNLNKAESLFKEALEIIEKNPGSDVTETALYNYNLGDLYLFKDDYEQAETFLKRALDLRKKILGEEHSETAKSYSSLARLYALRGDLEQAVLFQTKANQINEKNIDINLAIGTEHQKLSYMSLMWEESNQMIALHAKMARENTVARDQAVTTVLRRKGRVLDVMSDSLAALRRRLNSQDQTLLNRLNDLNAKLAELSLSEPDDLTLAEKQEQIAAIQEKKNKLETEISRQSAGFYKSSQSISLAAVQKAIPDDAALIEFAVYFPFDTKDGKSKYGEPRYVAYVIKNKGEIKWAELGEAKTIEESLKNFKQAVSDPKQKDFHLSAREVDKKLMSPVRALIGDKKHLLISPDGNLNLIPFEALVDENGKFLIENYAVGYLTGGRDLIRMQTRRESRNKALIIADPFFGEPDLQIFAKTTNANLNRTTKRKSLTAARNLSDTYFARLGGTGQEARAIQALFPDSEVLTRAQATESALKQTNAPRILHIATHGFFLEDKSISKDSNAKTENPLLRSGLAFAGANSRAKDGNDDGILTALEASGLNLWGTKLVVLSACDTGLGEVKNGEGVYGLRRAFVLAGTESLIMSLWSVSDYVTRELMTSYYKNLKAGEGRGAALRQVKLEMLKRSSRQHPFYWASFIQSGEWANLDGKR